MALFTLYGTDVDLVTVVFWIATFAIAVIIGYYIGKWVKNKRFKSRVATSFANLDPKTGLAKMREIPDYNERPASVRWEDERGHINRRNTDGHPTFQMDFAGTHGGGIERIYVCAANSRTCQSTEALCGQPLEDDITQIADHSVSLWEEQNTLLETEPPTFGQIWWQIVLGVLGGCAIGVILLTFWLSRQAPPHATNSTQAAIQMIRVAIGR